MIKKISNLNILLAFSVLIFIVSCAQKKPIGSDKTLVENLKGEADSVWRWNPETEKEELMIVVPGTEDEIAKSPTKDGIDSIWTYDPSKKTETLTVVKYKNGVADTLKHP